MKRCRTAVYGDGIFSPTISAKRFSNSATLGPVVSQSERSVGDRFYIAFVYALMAVRQGVFLTGLPPSTAKVFLSSKLNSPCLALRNRPGFRPCLKFFSRKPPAVAVAGIANRPAKVYRRRRHLSSKGMLRFDDVKAVIFPGVSCLFCRNQAFVKFFARTYAYGLLYPRSQDVSKVN